MTAQAPRHRAGDTLISALVGIMIFSLLLAGILLFQTGIFRFSKISEARSRIDRQNILVLRNFTKELRSSQPSSTGSYPIERADSRELIFYSDIGFDGIMDRIRYMVSGTTLQRGIIIPSGNPLTYNPASENITDVVKDVVGSEPIFTYASSTYNGTDSITVLAQPITIKDIRLVQIHYAVDPKILNLPFVHVTSTVTIRNLKSN